MPSSQRLRRRILTRQRRKFLITIPAILQLYQVDDRIAALHHLRLQVQLWRAPQRRGRRRGVRHDPAGPSSVHTFPLGPTRDPF